MCVNKSLKYLKENENIYYRKHYFTKLKIMNTENDSQ